MDSAELIPRSFRSAVNAFDANWGPLSEMILSGSPKHLYRCSSKSQAVGSQSFVASDENYPLQKALVYHDQERVETVSQLEIRD